MCMNIAKRLKSFLLKEKPPFQFTKRIHTLNETKKDIRKKYKG